MVLSTGIMFAELSHQFYDIQGSLNSVLMLDLAQRLFVAIDLWTWKMAQSPIVKK